MKPEPCYVSSGAFKTKSVSDIVALALEAGLQHIELGSGTSWAPNMLDRVCETANREIRYLVHNYFPPHQEPFVLNLASNDHDVLARSRTHCRRAVDLSAELRGQFFSVHAGFAFSARPDQLGRDLTKAPRGTLDKAHEIFVQSLRDLCTYATGKNVKVLVENNVIAPFNLVGGTNKLGLCASAEDVLQTYADVGSSNLGFLIDVGHLRVTAHSLGFDPHAFLDAIAPHVAAFHLSDNDGLADQNLPFDDKAWFLPRLGDFPDATMVLEAYQLEPKIIKDCCQVVDQARSRERMI